MDRIIKVVKRKIFLLLGRALLTAINGSAPVQTVQVTGLHGEIISDVEHIQPYGFTAKPTAGKDVFMAFINGNRDQGVALFVMDRVNRPTTLSDDDSMVWTVGGQQVWLKNKGNIVIDAAGKKVEVNGDADNAVAWTDLNTALQNLVLAINAELAKKVDGGGTPGSLVLDLSLAKVEDVLLP
jgi:phage baseplate assembly protein V